MKKLVTILTLLFTGPAFAGDWVLDSDASKVAFGSVKKDTVGEVHHFRSISGSVSDSGKVSVIIDVASVETWIDIRNERIQKFVLNSTPQAVLSAEVDINELTDLALGETTLIDVEGALTLNGNELPIETSLFVARLTDNKMMAVSDEMIMLSTQDAGIDDGVSKLMELAKLPGITRVSPVTLRLVFTK